MLANDRDVRRKIERFQLHYVVRGLLKAIREALSKFRMVKALYMIGTVGGDQIAKSSPGADVIVYKNGFYGGIVVKVGGQLFEVEPVFAGIHGKQGDFMPQIGVGFC